MSKDYKCFDNQKIEDSIFKVKASMNRLQNAIDYKTNYSEKIFLIAIKISKIQYPHIQN